MCQCGKQWQPAKESDINCFHGDNYIEFLKQLTSNAAMVADEVAKMRAVSPDGGRLSVITRQGSPTELENIIDEIIDLVKVSPPPRSLGAE